jgi:ligand-binding SRPBCC domain-containing protein
MPRIVLETHIEAPVEICFDLARDVDAHCETSAFTGERAVPPGRTSGLLEAGELVTFEGVHLGVRQRLTARITEMERPLRFVDDMVKGAFHSMRHTHEFEKKPDGTLMRDTIEWKAPLGPLGRLADRLFLEKHLRTFLIRKQADLKKLAETSRRST